MKNTFVIQTDDDNFKKSIGEFLSKHCEENDVNVAIYEMNQTANDELMEIVKKK